MMSLWDALRMNMMISYQELVRTFLKFLWHYPGANENNIDTTNGEVNKPVEYYFLYRKQSTVHRAPY